MLICPEGQDLHLAIAFTDFVGNPVSPTAYTVSLLDDLDRVLFEWASFAITTEVEIADFVVPAVSHVLASDEVRSARTLRVVFDTPTGQVRKAIGYVVEASQVLKVLTNTFQSYHAAEALSLSLTNVSGWEGANETRRKSALAEAYARLIAIPMSYGVDPSEGNSDWFNKDLQTLAGYSNEISRDMWTEIEVADFVTFPSRFRRALALAQLLEANELLQGDTVLDRFRAGIVRETIGESSMQLSAGRLDYGISIPALKALTGYISFQMRIARA